MESQKQTKQPMYAVNSVIHTNVRFEVEIKVLLLWQNTKLLRRLKQEWLWFCHSLSTRERNGMSSNWEESNQGELNGMIQA
jgi:hypothetical protein